MRRIIWLASCCCFWSSLLAQYDGGQGDGHITSQTWQLSLDGIPNGVAGLYQGGDDDGMAVSRGSGGLNISLTNGLFAGGRGDGHSQLTASIALSGQSLAGLYAGGQGDGFTQLAAASALDGFSLAGIYGGGNGDGHVVSVSATSLDGLDLAMLYGGGLGDGVDNKAVNILLGQPLAMLYGGGLGDGFSKVSGQYHLKGKSLAGLFDGGNGDGADVAYFAGALPLPMTLLSFEAIPNETFVLLKWVTEEEIGTDFFTIEKTREGRYFKAVGEVLAAGYSLPGEEIHYSLRDEKPYEGKSYYRLKTTDFDGYISYSHLLEVHYGDDKEWNFDLFPNPNTGQHLQVRLDGVPEEEQIQLSIVDIQGRRIQEQRLRGGPASQQVDLHQRLAAGTYLIRLQHPTDGQQTKILVVRR